MRDFWLFTKEKVRILFKLALFLSKLSVDILVRKPSHDKMVSDIDKLKA